MSVRLAWDNECPVEVRAAMAPYVDRYTSLLPGWLQELRLGFDDDDPNGIMYTRCDPEYRWARIMACGAWLKEDDQDRDETFLHEIIHIPVQPMVAVAEDLIAVLKETHAPMESWAREQLRRALESTVQDMTAMVLASRDRR